MKLRWHQRVTDHTEADRSSDDGGGQGAEYLDAPFRPVEDDEADRQSWYKARHWTTDEK